MLRRRGIDKIVCAKCGKDSEITIREGDIRGSLKILIHPCSCSKSEEKQQPHVMFIDDIEKKYSKFLGVSDHGMNLYSDWISYDRVEKINDKFDKMVL